MFSKKSEDVDREHGQSKPPLLRTRSKLKRQNSFFRRLSLGKSRNNASNQPPQTEEKTNHNQPSQTEEKTNHELETEKEALKVPDVEENLSQQVPDAEIVESTALPHADKNVLSDVEVEESQTSNENHEFIRRISYPVQEILPEHFDFERMVIGFEKVTFPTEETKLGVEGGLPYTKVFLDAIAQVILLFDELGPAFGFVRNDILLKTSIVRAYAEEKPEVFDDLETAVYDEVERGTHVKKPPPSASRTLLRLMWALKFIDIFLAQIRKALDPNANLPNRQRTLKYAASIAYSQALAEHHNWGLRQTVQAALNLLPSMHDFVHKIGAKPVYLERLGESMTPLVQAMYRFYKKHNLLRLP